MELLIRKKLFTFLKSKVFIYLTKKELLNRD